MTESNKNILIIGLLSLAIIILVLLHTGEINEFQSVYPPINSSNITNLTDIDLSVSNINAGPMDYDSAENYCRSKGMDLPTREQAWELWRASATCKIAMVTNRQVIKDKQTFMKSCHNQEFQCTLPANQVNYFCNPNDNLLFWDEKSFRHGNYWLKDRYDRNGHYTANFINGVTNAYADNIKLLGVRCVSKSIKKSL